jgi:hypothetical protein
MGERRFLCWAQHQEVISQEIFNIGDSNSMCDVIISNDNYDEHITVNSIILAACSPVYKSLLEVSGKIFKRSF